MIGMKFKFKLGDALLLIGTLTVFFLSIVLWIFIMTNDQYFNHISQTSRVTEQTRSRRDRIVSNLYIPTNSYGFKNGQLYRLYDAKKNLPLEFVKEIKGTKYRNIKEISTDKMQYEEMLHNEDCVQLSFPKEVSINLFTKKNVKKGDPKFRRVFITSSNDFLYLGNDKTYTIYRINLIKGNFNKLRNYANNARGRIPVEFVRLKNCYEVFFTKQDHWRIYSYLTNTQTDSYFVSRLLGTTNVTTRSNKKGWVTYSLNYYTNLRVPKAKTERHDFHYTRFEKRKDISLNEQLLESVNFVHKLGLSEQDLRYFDTTNDSISYANYVEGIPVFWDNSSPQVVTSFTGDAVKVDFNNTDLQIPIPFDGQTKTLPSSITVMQRLVNAGMRKEEIQRIIVAFGVEKDNSHDHLVNLVPGYYVKAYNQWKSLAEWEKVDFLSLNKYKQAIMEEGK